MDCVFFDNLAVIRFASAHDDPVADLADLKEVLGIIRDFEDPDDDALAIELASTATGAPIALVDAAEIEDIRAEVDGTGFEVVSVHKVTGPIYFKDIAVCRHPGGWVLL